MDRGGGWKVRKKASLLSPCIRRSGGELRYGRGNKRERERERTTEKSLHVRSPPRGQLLATRGRERERKNRRQVSETKSSALSLNKSVVVIGSLPPSSLSSSAEESLDLAEEPALDLVVLEDPAYGLAHLALEAEQKSVFPQFFARFLY